MGNVTSRRGGKAVSCPSMSVLSTTLCYPTPTAPTQGIFIQRRLREIHRLMPVKVVAPIPWFPLVRRMEFSSCCGVDDEPPVWRPRMFYVPGVMKNLDAAFYARAFRQGLARVKANINRQSSIVDRQLIDAHFVWPDGVGAWRVARHRNLPFVCTIRGKLVSQIEEPSKKRLIREMLRDADALIAVSKSLVGLANEVAGRDLGVRVIPNGVDTTIFRRRRKTECRERDFGAADVAQSLGLPPGQGRGLLCRYVVSVGHLQELKGFHRLIEIWPEVRRRAGDARLLLVGGAAGEPAYERRLRQQIDNSGLGPCDGKEGAIQLLGRRNPDEIAELLNAAKLFVLASRSEGWSNAIVEALACGCPVVATDVGGNREIVNDLALGMLAPLGDPAALVEMMCQALEKDWDRKAIAEAGAQRDWQQVARECVDVFNAVLSANG